MAKPTGLSNFWVGSRRAADNAAKSGFQGFKNPAEVAAARRRAQASAARKSRQRALLRKIYRGES